MDLRGRIGIGVGLPGPWPCGVAGTPALVLEREQLTTGPMPAPRWNRQSNALLVPGWAEDGTRQLFVLRVKSEH